MSENRFERPEMITFDFGDTLVTSAPSYLSRLSLGLDSLGISRSLSQVEAAFHLADLEVCSKLAGSTFEPDEYRKGLRDGLYRNLDLNGDRSEMFEELNQWFADNRPERVLIDGARELLDALQAAGYRVAVISNNDGQTRQKCEAVDIERYMEFILDSTLEGLMKPDKRIFERALELAGLSADKVLHVGDLWGSDVLGSQAAGMWSMWISNNYIDPQSLQRAFRVDDLKGVLSRLDL